MTNAERCEKTVSVGEWKRLQETNDLLLTRIEALEERHADSMKALKIAFDEMEDKRQRQTEWATREIGSIQERLTDIEKHCSKQDKRLTALDTRLTELERTAHPREESAEEYLGDLEKRIAILETEAVRYSKQDGGFHRHLVRGQS